MDGLYFLLGEHNNGKLQILEQNLYWLHGRTQLAAMNDLEIVHTL
jgi:hypothetical protein